MSTEVQEIAPKKEGLFSKKNRKLLSDPLNDSNPITVQVLGICSALAITVQVQQAVIMSLSVVFVMIGGNVIISLMRNIIPDRIRIIVQLVVVAALVIIVNEVLKAYLPDISEKLSVFVGLIITNCIIMGRLEAFALANKPGPSFLDAIGNGIGYAWILLAVAFVREIFGSGAFSFPGLGQVKFLPSSWFIKAGDAGMVGFYENNNLMILPPMALVVVGVIIWIQRSKNRALIEEN
ncbi:MAG: NADH:ubiquinone reductase (Na(+)-transporting) subunit D [Flavobacteriales bacterium]|jgi:Na+-transporting NADH:ubiquinone oxidoreductase subunit D|nr:NADH:ubiquinone reductase (Na(+)-transporting) subunit D [Flavobacteriales bacterium]MDG1767107.1 NADH:ubiquinone reductase (Na(+)-transporting) subunit D [Flavobacteriales bacterium]MDP4665673.1 NADH:ubiquinone reductase (Na(+)-transporting) subunit D [Flavobacteriaceae bacterium]